MFDWNMKIPFYYGNTYLSLANAKKYFEADGYEWAAARRHLALLHSRGGRLGIGSGWRKTPHSVSLASMRGESFHQDQKFSNGWIGPTAIDYVWEDGSDPGNFHDVVPTGGVPVQGSAEAKVYGIHANVGVPGYKGFESWHGQPVEIDGWASATDGGRRPAPMIDPNYFIPEDHNPDPDNVPPTGGGGEEDDMQYLATMDRMHDSRPGNHQMTKVSQVTLKPGENRKIPLGMAFVHAVRITVVNSRGFGFVSITGTPGIGNPIVNMWNGKEGDGTLTLATPDGHGYLATTVECDVIVDVTGRG